MSAPNNTTEHIGKSELLLRLRTSRDPVASLLAAIPPAAFLQSDTIDRWSVRDLLAHFVAHEQRALAEIAQPGGASAWRAIQLVSTTSPRGPCARGQQSSRQRRGRRGIGRMAAL